MRQSTLSIPLHRYGQQDGSGDESDYEYTDGDGLLNRWRDQTPTDHATKPSLALDYLRRVIRSERVGFRAWVALLAIVLGFMEAGTSVLNRMIFITGVWRFSYPITITFGQVLATHVCFMLWMLLTRLLQQPLAWLGLENVIAPPVRKLISPGAVLTLGAADLNLLQTLQVLPLATVFVAKLFFGNLSFAYVSLSKYTISKLPVLPLLFLLTPLILGPKASYSRPILVTSLTSLTGLLLICLHQHTPDATSDTLIYGLLSSLFSALYSPLLLRTHAALTHHATISHAHTSRSSSIFTSTSSSPTRSRTPEPRLSFDAYDYDDSPPTPAATTYTLLTHLTTTVTLLFLPLLYFSAEIPHIRHNCYILDVPKFWVPVLGSFATSFGGFVTTALLVRACGPAPGAVVGVVRQGVLVLVLEGGAHWMAWVLWIGGAVGWVGVWRGRRWV